MRHSYHFKFVLRKDHIKVDGSQTINLQAIVNRKRVVVPTGISVKADEFDGLAQRVVIPEDDALSQEFNLVLHRARNRATQIFLEAKAMDRELTTVMFRDLFRMNGRRNSDFISFMRNELASESELEYGTSRTIMSTINKVEDMYGRIEFSELNKEWVLDFERRLRMEKASLNTRHKHHRYVKKYLRRARELKVFFDDPYQGFKNQRKQGERDSLTVDELRTLFKALIEGNLPSGMLRVLRYFLFSCITGIRWMDIRRLHWDMVTEGTLIFQPKKTRRFETTVKFPITEVHRLLIPTAEGLMFPRFLASNNVTNASIQAIMVHLGLRPQIRYHWSRHTAVSMMLSKTNDLASIMQLTGIANFKTLQTYSHVNGERRKKVADSMAELLGSLPSVTSSS